MANEPWYLGPEDVDILIQSLAALKPWTSVNAPLGHDRRPAVDALLKGFSAMRGKTLGIVEYEL